MGSAVLGWILLDRYVTNLNHYQRVTVVLRAAVNYDYTLTRHAQFYRRLSWRIVLYLPIVDWHALHWHVFTRVDGILTGDIEDINIAPRYRCPSFRSTVTAYQHVK